MAGRGKIDRLSLKVREHLNRRLRDGQPASLILPWLNSLPETRTLLADHFDSEPVNDHNLSNYRTGQFAKWLARQDRVDHVRELAKTAADLARAAGGNLSEGAAAIVTGQILDALEAESDSNDPAARQRQVDQIVALRATEIAEGKLKLDREKLKRKDAEIGLQSRRVQLLEDRAREAKEKLTGLVSKGGLTPETIREIELAAKLL